MFRVNFKINRQLCRETDVQRKICVQNGDGMDDFAEWIYEVNPSVCIICDEVGSGIVPIDKNMRDYRELVGRVLCRLAQKSDEMERITCGVGMRIK